MLINKLFINQTGNGNPPPKKPRKLPVPQERDPVDDAAPVDPPVDDK